MSQNTAAEAARRAASAVTAGFGNYNCHLSFEN